ncbi:alpha/beta-hydrolase [Meredithblackwellia eburnea MCA 4105]
MSDAHLRVKRQTITTKDGRFQTCVAFPDEPASPSKPTLALIHSFATSVDMFAREFKDEELTGKFNLIAIGCLGHEIEAKVLKGGDSYNLWDQARLVVDVMESLNIPSYFIAGVSQGGFVAMRAAVLEPERVKGIVAFGSGFNTEGGFNQFFQDQCDEALAGSKWDNDDYKIPQAFKDWFIPLGWGKDADPEITSFWEKSVEERYQGKQGALRFWNAQVELLERDIMRNRLHCIQCPLWFLHGELDYGIYPAMVTEQFNSWVPDTIPKRLEIAEGGAHFLLQSRPEACKKFILEFHEKFCN